MKVAVIGAGAMGSGIAQTFAQCDAVEKVYLCDIKQEFADGGLAKLVSKGKMEQAAADAITGKIVTGLNTVAVDPDLVVEAALERMDIKQDCFKKLQDEIVQNPDCIYASNTSSLSITEIGAGLSKPIIGMHFFNPAPVMKLVEVIAGINTPAETVEKVIEISKQLGKVPVLPRHSHSVTLLRKFTFATSSRSSLTAVLQSWNSAISSAWISALQSWMSSLRRLTTTSMLQALCFARWSAARDLALRPASVSMIIPTALATRCPLTRNNLNRNQIKP